MAHPQVIAYRSGELPPEPTDRSGPNNRAEMQDFLGRLAAKHGSRKYTKNRRPSEWEVYSSDASDQVKLFITRLGQQIVCQPNLMSLYSCKGTYPSVGFLWNIIQLAHWATITKNPESRTKIKCVQRLWSQTTWFFSRVRALCIL